MNLSFLKRKGPTRLARPPPVAVPPLLRRLQQILRKTRNGAQLRLDKRVPPPAFAIASPGPGEGEAMAKAGGGRGKCDD
jgi:hypothetical protein